MIEVLKIRHDGRSVDEHTFCLGNIHICVEIGFLFVIPLFFDSGFIILVEQYLESILNYTYELENIINSNNLNSEMMYVVSRLHTIVAFVTFSARVIPYFYCILESREILP